MINQNAFTAAGRSNHCCQMITKVLEPFLDLTISWDAQVLNYKITSNHDFNQFFIYSIIAGYSNDQLFTWNRIKNPNHHIVTWSWWSKGVISIKKCGQKSKSMEMMTAWEWWSSHPPKTMSDISFMMSSSKTFTFEDVKMCGIHPHPIIIQIMRHPTS